MAAEVDAKTRIQELKRVLALLDKEATSHDLLGIPPTADPKAARTAWLSLARLLHPDQATFHKEGLRVQATRAVQGINRAHQEMAKPDYSERLSRANAMANAGGRGTNGSGTGSDGAFKQGLAHVNAARWSEAEETLLKARRGGSAEPDARCEALLGWAVYNNTKRSESVRGADARAALNRVMEGTGSAKGRAMAHYYMALLLQDSGHTQGAKEQLERCLHVDPLHREAMSLQRILRRRARGEAAPVGKTLWQRFFGGKA